MNSQKLDPKIAENFHIPRWQELPSIELYMDQVTGFVNSRIGPFFEIVGGAPLTKNMVNNYVKAKIVNAPKNKRYDRLCIAMIIVVYILKSCYETEEVGKLIQMGIRIDNTELTYDRFCEALERAVNAVFQGEIHVVREHIEGRENKYLMDNFALSFACKHYVKAGFLRQQK
ncbi:MAG: DUF1836 domain-containing protein [Clostridiales bacterium]|nr:DUF1836 domain-containing protein [Clostridiales bacterium]